MKKCDLEQYDSKQYDAKQYTADKCYAVKYDSVIFDLDGTLWDATSTITDAWNEGYRRVMKAGKKVTQKELMDCMGLLIPDIAAKLYPDLPKEKQLEIMEETIKIENEWLAERGGCLYPDLREVMVYLKEKGIHVSIVSNCQAGYIEAFMKAHEMNEYIMDWECPGNTGKLKSENIKLVAERNQLKSPVYVGDTATDAMAAKKAGVPFVFAAYGFGDVGEYEARIDCLLDLKKFCWLII